MFSTNTKEENFKSDLKRKNIFTIIKNIEEKNQYIFGDINKEIIQNKNSEINYSNENNFIASTESNGEGEYKDNKNNKIYFLTTQNPGTQTKSEKHININSCENIIDFDSKNKVLFLSDIDSSEKNCMKKIDKNDKSMQYNDSLLGKKLQRSTNKSWTEEEDQKLCELISNHGKKAWSEISSHFTNKSRKQCFLRWRRVLNKSKNTFLNCNQNKAASDFISQIQEANINMLSPEKYWSTNEDEVIIRWVNIMGIKSWTKCSKLLIGKTPKDCRDRWINKLSYDNRDKEISGEIWSKREEILLLLFIRKFGNCWSKLVRFFENKTTAQIKNKFYCLARISLKSESSLELDLNDNSVMEFKKSHEADIIEDEYEYSYNKANLSSLKAKTDKIILHIINSKDKNILKQNIQLFKEAKNLFMEKINELNMNSRKNMENTFESLLIENNDRKDLLKCESIPKANNFTNNENTNYPLQNKKPFKILNLCNKCLINMRIYIKKRIIAKIRDSKVNMDINTLKNILSKAFRIINNNFNCNSQQINFNLNLNKICSNYGFGNSEAMNHQNDTHFNNTCFVNNSKVDIINNIPQLFSLINTIKDKIIN